MGGSGSTRRVVVEQMDSTGVVRISESVVKRLKGEPDSEGTVTSSVVSTPEPEVTRPSFIYPKKREGEASAVQEIENFYKQKIKELEEREASLSQIAKTQFAQAVQEVESKFIKQTFSPVCEYYQNKVYDCYLENPSQTLKCSPEVRAFTSCVDKAKLNALTRRGCP